MSDEYYFPNKEFELVKNTIHFLKNVVGSTKNVKIVSNVFSKYAITSVENAEFDENGKLVWNKIGEKDDSMNDSYDVYELMGDSNSPITYEHILDVIEKILNQMKYVEKKDLDSNAVFKGITYDSSVDAYVMEWSSTF